MTLASQPLHKAYSGLAKEAGAGIKQQRGSTLLVGLIMLVLLTLVAVSAINSTTSSVQMVGNAQFREEATAAAKKRSKTSSAPAISRILRPRRKRSMSMVWPITLLPSHPHPSVFHINQ